METPVIYFYPEKSQQVSVDVTFQGGDITETYPFTPWRLDNQNLVGSWTGTLLPPDDPSGLKLIPEIKTHHPDEPYVAARNVPDAWIFKSHLEKHPLKSDVALPPQGEKFIFYRGAGTSPPRITAAYEGGIFTVYNFEPSNILFGIALHVSGGLAEWTPIPLIGKSAPNSKANRFSGKFMGEKRSIDEVESELADIWKTRLSKEGLTPDEASAMVETWRRTWFRESGDRILYIVPREVTDRMLPLKISPEPVKTERVFVARVEMFSKEREEEFATLLNETTAPDELVLARLDKMELGRFANGAFEAAVKFQRYKMSAKFLSLQAPKAEQSTSSR